MTKINIEDEVRVAYENEWYLGQIKSKSTWKPNVRIEFLSREGDLFKWPKKKDVASMSPKIIFNPHVNVEHLTELENQLKRYQSEYLNTDWKQFSLQMAMVYDFYIDYVDFYTYVLLSVYKKPRTITRCSLNLLYIKHCLLYYSGFL